MTLVVSDEIKILDHFLAFHGAGREAAFGFFTDQISLFPMTPASHQVTPSLTDSCNYQCRSETSQCSDSTSLFRIPSFPPAFVAYSSPRYS